ncbi:FAD-dependent tricarballylate dehydrogenase TcuA [Virgibacillus salexigens]|uniref:Fumarate reductase flavoprotein subunit n=2 Tax=Virgibacillus TaxID=84406 RepID=A0A024QF55_9BACI|nr:MULTISPECIES: FAD-dependent tricarballylate dehydrogenase TcuA [Virgibacillus]GGJ71014.1 tricarballylate dehydrogenase [Virgibacillus kapii]CDQ40872.1 Fumarate reductase flavoprotein subunit precursor [Virgibacillus massiliensis]
MKQAYDVIVVGAGNAALCSAIAASEQGAKVVVLEKAPKHKRGGNSFFTDGAIRVAYEDFHQIREIIPDITDEEADKIEMPVYTKDDYYDDLMRVTAGKSDTDLAHQLVGSSLETIKWMRQQGVAFELNAKNQSFINDGKRHFWGGLPLKTKNKGIGLIGQLFHRIDELGIDVLYEARAMKLLKEADRVNGVVVEHQGEAKALQGASVVLACGSFEADKEMRKQHIGDEWEAAIVRGTEFNTGDGIEMALAVGAQKYGEWSGCHSIGTDYNAPRVGDFEKPGDIFKKHSYPISIMLNKDGQRFVDEGADFRNYTYAKYGKEILKQKDHVAYQIYDVTLRPLLREEYDLEEATSFQADTLEELVDQLPVNKKAFIETIYEYNDAVQAGTFNPSIKDGKHTEGITPPKTNWAAKIEQGPFYAFPVTCGITFAFGGLHVNTDGKVLDEDAQPINGLFAAGEMVGGIFYENYPGGSGLMSGAVYGKIAGTEAGKYVQSVNVMK